MTAWRDRNFWLRAAALLALLAGIVAPPVTVSRPVYTLVAVLDITMSMNVRDAMVDGVPTSRIAAGKRVLHALLAQLPCGSRLGIAIFVERQPFLLFDPVEICGNFSALDAEIDAIDWRMGWDSESHIATGFLASLRMARGLGADLAFMTDGQETPPLSWDGAPDFSGVRNEVRGVIIGIGGRRFSPIPKFDSYGREIGIYKAGDVPSETAGLFRGREHLSAVDEPHLRALAADTGLAYGHLEPGFDPVADYRAEAKPILRKEQTSLRWIAGSVAFLLALAATLPRSGAAFGQILKIPLSLSGSFLKKRTKKLL
jgi:mxaL protein